MIRCARNLEGAKAPLPPWLPLCLQEKNQKEGIVAYLLNVQSSTDKKLATAQDRQTLQNSYKKQYCRYSMLRLVVANWTARKQRLLVESLYVS